MSARSPKVSSTARRSALAPSITTRMARLGLSPRSIRSSSSALHAADSRSRLPAAPADVWRHRCRSQPRQHHVFSEVHAVDEQRDQLEPAEFAPHQLGQPALGASYETFAHRALADAADCNLLRQWLQRARVAPVESPTTICSKARSSSGSRELHAGQLGKPTVTIAAEHGDAGSRLAGRPGPKNSGRARPAPYAALLMRIASSAQRRALRLQFLLHEPES